jgi:hypothetical protein
MMRARLERVTLALALWAMAALVLAVPIHHGHMAAMLLAGPVPSASPACAHHCDHDGDHHSGDHHAGHHSGDHHAGHHSGDHHAGHHTHATGQAGDEEPVGPPMLRCPVCAAVKAAQFALVVVAGLDAPPPASSRSPPISAQGEVSRDTARRRPQQPRAPPLA